jgi:hypothetical protein
MNEKLQSFLASANAVIHTKGRVLCDGEPASHRTVEHAADVMASCCRRLHKLGFHLESVNRLEALHIDAVVKSWHLDALGAKTMESQLSKVRIFCDWLGKPELIRKGGLQAYLPEVDPSLLKVKPNANAIELWLEVAEKTMRAADGVRTDELRFYWILQVGIFFGLSRKETLVLFPHQADKGTHLEIPRPGGGVRCIPIFSQSVLGHVQRLLLNEIKAGCKRGDSLAWPGRTLEQSASRVYGLMRRLGMSAVKNGISLAHLIEAFKQYECSIIELLPLRWRESLPASFLNLRGTRVGNIQIDTAGDIVGGLYVWPATTATGHGTFVPLTEAQAMQARITFVVEKIGSQSIDVDLQNFLDLYPQFCDEVDTLLARVALTLRKDLIQPFTAEEPEMLKKLPPEILIGIGIRQNHVVRQKTMHIGRLPLDAEGAFFADIHVWPVTPVTELGCHAPLTYAQTQVAKATAIVKSGGIYHEPVCLMRFLRGYPDLYEDADWILGQFGLSLPGKSELEPTPLH